MAEFFFATDGNQQGPYSIDQLLAHGMRRDSLAWRDGMGDWQRADTVPELAGLFQPAPPPPVSAYGGQQGQGYAPPMQPMGYAQPYMNAGPRTSGLAVTSMIMGILALVPCLYWLVVPFAILAITFGMIARGSIRRGEASGAGMATSGIVCGTISLAIVVLITVMVLSIGLHLMNWKPF